MGNNSSVEALTVGSSQYDPAALVGIVVMFAVAILELVLIKKGVLLSRSERRLAKAKAAGHMLKATLVKTTFKDQSANGNYHERIYTGVYEYQVNGRTRKTYVHSKDSKPSNVVTMYYVSNPEKAFTEEESGGGIFTIMLMLIPLLAGIATSWALGYRG